MYFKESGRTEKGISFPCAALAGNYPHPKPPPARKSPEFAAFSAFSGLFFMFLVVVILLPLVAAARPAHGGALLPRKSRLASGDGAFWGMFGLPQTPKPSAPVG